MEEWIKIFIEEISPDFKYIEGTCFICKTKCESYAHYHCCIAYTDDKKNKIKEAIIKKEERQNKLIK